MSDNKNQQSNAYAEMLERIADTLKKAEAEAAPKLRHMIDEAREFAVGVGDLTREEAEKIGAYLQRDLEDAAKYMDETGKEMREWLRFDLDLIEERMANAMSRMVDHTQLELQKLAERAAAHGDTWRTGEVVGPGTLRCKACGADMDFKKPGPVPPCPKCHKTQFERPWE